MDCEKVRDRFSSLWERELTSSEVKMIGEHLSSCPECRREFQRFEKTMGWLCSVEEVEVPKGFLPELYKKMKEQKRVSPGEKVRGRWFGFPLSLKLPAQAVAMVAIVFLVLYLTKMMPMETYRMSDIKQPSTPLSEERKSEQVLSQRETDQEERVLETPPEIPHPKDVDLAELPAPKEKKYEGAYGPQVKAEAKRGEAPSSGAETVAYQPIEPKEAARQKAPSPELGKFEKGLATKEKSVVASKPPQEIILKFSDRDKMISKLQELVKQFGGEMVKTEENMFLASLPAGSFPAFEKELIGLSPPTQADKVVKRKQISGDLKAAPGVKMKEVDEKIKEPVKHVADQENRTMVHILLVQE